MMQEIHESLADRKVEDLPQYEDENESGALSTKLALRCLRFCCAHQCNPGTYAEAPILPVANELEYFLLTVAMLYPHQ